MKWIVGAAAVAALSGCGGSVCDQLKSIANNCGKTIDESACTSALTSCSSADQKLLNTLANCVSPACSSGKLVDGGAALETGCLAAAGGISTACGQALGPAFPSPPNTSSASEQGNPKCPTTPAYLTGTGAAGSACDDELGCQPICCSCSNGDGKQYLAAECNSGACAPALACAATETTALCP
jgi:hypothetical protein